MFSQITRCCLLLLLPLCCDAQNKQSKKPSPAEQAAAKKKEAARVVYEKKLQRVDPDFTGGDFKRWQRDYLAALKNHKQWQQVVKAAKDSDTRTSRAGEYLAFSGEFRIEPVQIGKYKFPLKTKNGYQVFAFRAVAQKVKGKWVKVPTQVRKRTYLMVRGLVPRENNPFAIVTSTYTGKMSSKGVEALVKQSLKF